MELSSTRHNPGIDPSLHLWGWEIAVYLFLGGLVAGLMALAGYRILRGEPRTGEPEEAWPWAPLVGVVLLSLGMGALFLDLEHRLYVFRVYLTFQPTSPMSWGSWILLLVYPAMLGAALLYPPERMPLGNLLLPWLQRASGWLHARPSWVRALGVANLGGGVALGIYTGILLGSLGARPLWNSAILGPLFLVSGLSTASALQHLLGRLGHGGEGRGLGRLLLATVFRTVGRGGHEAMVRLDVAFLALELVALFLLLLGLVGGSQVHREAADLLLTGPWAAPFWGGVVITGVAIPLVLQALELAGRVNPTPIPALLVLGGGFLLRWIFVFAGQASRWH